MIKYLGIFLSVIGFALLNEQRRRKKGEETWEQKHGINVPKWLSIAMIVVGIVLTFGSNFKANLSVTGLDGEKKVIYTTEENNSNITVDPTESAKEPVIKEQKITEEDSNTDVIPELTKEAAVTEAVDNKDFEDSKMEVFSFSMNDGTPITLYQPDGMVIENGDGTYVTMTDEPYEHYAYYGDSYVEIGDTYKISERFNEHGCLEENVSTLEYNGRTSYAGFIVKDSGTQYIYFYQDIGASNYLLIQITDYTGEDIFDMLNMFALNL